jgi:hypothetical protein
MNHIIHIITELALVLASLGMAVLVGLHVTRENKRERKDRRDSLQVELDLAHRRATVEANLR